MKGIGEVTIPILLQVTRLMVYVGCASTLCKDCGLQSLWNSCEPYREAPWIDDLWNAAAAQARVAVASISDLVDPDSRNAASV